MKTLALFLALAGIASAEPPDNVKLAEKEICRYVYLRTGKLQPCPVKLRIDPSLGAQEYRITADTITGGSDVGVRFYLHGDVELDEAMRLSGDRLIITGGITAKEFERLRTLFERMRPWAHRFMFAASCNTPYTAPWQTIVWFRDAWREYGDLARKQQEVPR